MHGEMGVVLQEEWCMHMVRWGGVTGRVVYAHGETGRCYKKSGVCTVKHGGVTGRVVYAQ